MAGVFLAILSMSLTGSAVILAVLLARVCLRRAPKKVSYLLWIPVAFRLICPVSFASPLSLFRLPGLDAASEVSHISAALSENIDSYDDWLDDTNSEEKPSEPADFSAPSSGPQEAVPAGTTDSAPAEPGFSSSAEEVAAPVSEDPAPALSVENPQSGLPHADDPADVPPTNELPDAGPVLEDPSPITEFPPVTQMIPSGDDTPEETAEPASVSAPVEQPDGNAEETHDLPLPDSSEESLAFLDRVTGIWTRVLTPLSFVWLAGVAVLLIYGLVSTLAIRRMMNTAVWREDNVWESDRMRSPFILGLIRPRIYIPFGLEGDCRRYVLAHERYHLRCRDDLSKAAGWLILALHWFNPLVWLAFRLMSRDMEMRCDEAVLSGSAGETGSAGIAKAYSMSLLSFAADEQIRFPLSPAFGECDVESRIRRILDWKKPKIWVSVLAGVLVLAVILVCASDPVTAVPAESEPTVQTGPETDRTGETGENIPASAAFVPLADLPDGDWTPLTVETKNVLYTTGGWMDDSLSSYIAGYWNGWYRENGAFCSTTLRLAPYTKDSFRWTCSAGEVSCDYRGTYRIGEDGLLTARFGIGADQDEKPYEAVFRVRYDAHHDYGTEYREVLGVTLVSATVSGFDAWIGRELPMTGAAWFRGDLDGDPADAIVKMSPSDGDGEFFPPPDALLSEMDSAKLVNGENLDSFSPEVSSVALAVSDLGDLLLYAERAGENGQFLLTSFRWQGERVDLPRPLAFLPYWFRLRRAGDLAFFSSEPPSGPDAEQLLVLLTSDGAYCFDNAGAGVGYLLSLYTEEDGKTVTWSRINADFLNLQTNEELLRFRGREDEPLSESGTLRYDGDRRFVFSSDERLTGSEWFEARKKAYPTSYPEETFGSMSFREYLSDWLPREIRDNNLRAKGLFTPEEAENLAAYLIEGMMHQDWLAEDYVFTDNDVSAFIMCLGMMQANAERIPVPEALTKLWGGIDGSDGIFRANAFRVAREMFGRFPVDPSVYANEIFAYNEAKDCYEVVFPTGLSHGYFDYEDMSVVWDDVSVTVRFRLVSYLYDPAEDNGHTNLSLYSDKRIDYGEYRLIFYKTNSLYTNELPRILFAKCGESEADNTTEPPVDPFYPAEYPVPDFFDEEQKDLYYRAMAFLPAVWGPSGSYIEDAFSRKDGEPFVSGYYCPAVTIYDPESGSDLRYHICRGRYENWADFDAAGRALFTAELWESLTGPGKKCAEYGGKTCMLEADAGSGGHAISLDRFELLEKTNERIVYRYTTFYLARGNFALESAERVTITMVNTADGWRFASFRNGNWEPAGVDEVERLYLHVNTPEGAGSLVRMLVRGVMDDTWLTGRISYTPSDALYFTQRLKTAFTDTAFPFRETALFPDGSSWMVHADTVRNAVRELFGIRDFDYFAAAREVYGEDADISASIDEMGWISFPADIGDHTTKFDVSEVYSYEEDGVVTVLAHIVNASDYPWDEADYGIFCFTFALNFDGPGLTVERTAVQWSRADVEAEIARLTGQRTIAVNDMNNASEKTAELEEEIHALRTVLEAESGTTVEDRTYAAARLKELYAQREQQYALAERCLNVVKEFAARIRMYEQILAEMDGGSYEDDPLSARLRGLTAKDILTLTSNFDHITAQELAPILNRTGILGGQPAPEDSRSYYTLDVYLSETPSGGFGSESETLTLFAGLERDLVRILWSGKGTDEAEERFVRDAALYRILRENYRLTEQIDADAFEKWGEAARERAAEAVESTRGMDGRPAFTDYRIVSFAVADAFERDGAWYTVCSWQPVFLTDDPDNVVWAGGMLLDADGRVIGAELETYLAEKWTEDGTRTAFFLWDLYNGPDEATGLAWGRDRIVEAFERLENEGDGTGQDTLLSYTLAPVFEESVRTGLYKRKITILGFESDSVHSEEINAFLKQGEATRESYLNGVRDTEYPSPEWYDDWVLSISASGAEYGDLLFLTVRTVHPSTYIDVPQYDTLILDRRTDRLISLDEAATALGFDAETRTAVAKKAFVSSIGGLREDQAFKYFEFRDFAALEGRLYGRYEYDFYGVDHAQDWLELVDKGSVLTAEDADTLGMELSRYLRITEIDSASVPHDAAIADETGLYFKVTDEEFASWDGWQAFVRNIFTEEAAERILADPDGVMKEVGGFSFVRPGAGGGFDPNRYRCTARYEEGRYKLIIVYSAPPLDEGESSSIRRVFPLRYENGAWRVERMESEPVHALTFNTAERTASSLDALPNLGLNENDARLAYIRAFVTGDVERLEEICGVPAGMYAAYRTMELSSWTAWIDPDEAGGPLHFAFVPAVSDVEAFPADTRIEGTVYESLLGAYFRRNETPASYGEAADELYELLSRHILLDLPTTDEMDAPTRFELTCYICGKLGDGDLSEEAYREYAKKHFGIENFTPDGAHVGMHGGHGGSHQVLDVIAVAEEVKDGTLAAASQYTLVVTVQYYADWSKTVNSGTWQYTMRETDDGWLFAGSEEIRHSEWERARQVM